MAAKSKEAVDTAQDVGADDFPGSTALNTQTANTAVSTEVMSFEEDGGAQFGLDDVSIPFIVVLQALSPQCDKQDPAYVDGAEPGMILNTATGHLWSGEKGMMVIVVTHQRRYTEWWPRGSKKGKGLVTDFGTGRAEAVDKVLNVREYPWVTKDETVVVEAGVYYVMALDDQGFPQRGVINLQGTQLKKYKQLNTLMSSWMLRGKTGRSFNPPTFARTYRMTTVPESNDQGRWFGVKFAPGPVLGPTGDEALDARIVPGGGELYGAARAFYKQIHEGEVEIAKPMSDIEATAQDGEEEAPF